MDRAGRLSRCADLEYSAAIVVALARTGLCFYRAAHQSIVIDEAMSFERFIRGPWRSVYSLYDANNHVLYSILAKLSTHIFGLSELSLRLPSVIAGFFLSLGIFHLLRLTTPWWIRWNAFIALLLHPLLLDFSVAARGYGLSLAFLIWAIDFAIGRRYIVCGILLGLALSANLTVAYAAAGLFLAILLLEEAPWAARLRSVVYVVAPAAIIFLAICFKALRTAQRSHFYFGYSTLRESVINMVSSSLRTADRAGPLGTERAIHVFLVGVLPLVVIFVVVASLLGSGNRRRLFPFVTLAGAMTAMIAGHYAVGLSYPADRTGLQVPLLFGIAWAIAAASVRSRFLQAINVAVASLLAFQFATQMHMDYFSSWKFDMETKEVAQRIERLSAGKPANSLSVCATWWNQPSLEFYRRLLNITALQPVERIEPMEYSGHDFFVFSGDDVRSYDPAKIRVLFVSKRAGVVFGVPAGGGVTAP